MRPEAIADRTVARRAARWLRETALPGLVAGVGAGLAVGLLAWLAETFERALLVAPLGSSCVLVFAVPGSPFARPRNVIGGHVVSALSGLVVLLVLGPSPLALGLGVGLALVAMQVTGTMHPPAGGVSMIAIAAGGDWSFLAFPVLSGAVLIVIFAALYRRGERWRLPLRGPASVKPPPLSREGHRPRG